MRLPVMSEHDDRSERQTRSSSRMKHRARQTSTTPISSTIDLIYGTRTRNVFGFPVETLRQDMTPRQNAPDLRCITRPIRADRWKHVPGTLRRQQCGAFAVMFIPLLMVMLGFCGLALDMGRIYNRKVDLHGMAKAAAIAAARELNGTPAGITSAKNAAREAVERLRYQHFGRGLPFTWSDEALSFSASSDRNGTWIASSAASGAAVASLYFARMDSDGLAPEISTVETSFIRILANSLSAVRISDSAIAGRTTVNIVPIGICAMSPNAATVRTATNSSGSTLSELVQHGFRRGVSYDLMQLNPNGIQPLRFAINPAAPPGTTSSTFAISALAPFVCHGSMWVPQVTGGQLRVSELPSPAPLASLHAALNTRFDQYASTACTPNGAPPDINIKSYAYDQAGVVRWMSPNIGSPAALPTTERGKLETVADLPTPPSSPGNYGPLWAYAKAARAPSPLDSPEPANGYSTFTPNDWSTLYKSGPTASGYPVSPPTPYQSGLASSGNYQPPRAANRPLETPHRRVLNIPLLSCAPSAPSGSNTDATVVGIARFFMTVPATEDSLVAEFAGLVPEKSLSGQVELFP